MDDNELQFSTRTCAVCGLPEISRHDTLCREGAFGEVLIHLRCYNTPEAHTWRERQRIKDLAYESRSRWMVHRRPIQCLHCGVALDLSVKGIGMGAEPWSLHCSKCHRIGRGKISAYGEDGAAYKAIQDVLHDFARSLDLENIDSRMREVARRLDYIANNGPCECGGRFSLAAKVRCPHCNEVAIDSVLSHRR